MWWWPISACPRTLWHRYRRLWKAGLPKCTWRTRGEARYIQISVVCSHIPCKFKLLKFHCQIPFPLLGSKKAHNSNAALDTPARHQNCKLFFSLIISSYDGKIKIVNEAAQRIASGESLRLVARSFNVDPSQICKWLAKVVQLAQTKHSKKSLATGRKGHLFIWEFLRWWWWERNF